MHNWTLTETHPTQGRTYQRSPDPAELRFIWDGHLLNGIGDSLHHIELRLLNPSQDIHLFSDANVVKAWLSTKRRHPLVGATLQVLQPEDGDTAPTVHLVVREHDLAVLRPHEIVFGHVGCVEELPKRMAAISGGSRPLSNDLLAQLYVFRETDPQRNDVLHLIAFIAHCAADGLADTTLMRCLLDSLARGGEPGRDPSQIPLEERLAMLIPTADFVPMHLRSLSPATQRWRLAIGAVMFQSKMPKGHFDQGGHTLPCRRTRATPDIPAQLGFASMFLTEAQTTAVLANCRLHGVTFGSAYLALAQVAMTRVLYRRYLRGEISEEEWEYRKRQPYLITGAVNLRPHLDESWYKKGGGGEFINSVTTCFHRLPFMTLGETERRHSDRSDAPPFSDLLTFDRFLHRAELVKKQEKAFVGHPLFFEMVHAAHSGFARHTLQRIQHRDIGTTNDIGDNVEVLAVTDVPSTVAHTVSNLGNTELISPSEYPLSPTHPLSPFSSVPHPAKAGYVAPVPAIEMDTTPRIAVQNIYMPRLRTRPAGLYLGTLSSRGKLSMYVCYDGNVYKEGVVKEWLDEVREAVLWYLGQTHRSRRDQHGCANGA